MFDVVTYIAARNAAKEYTDEKASINWTKEIVNEVPDPSEADEFTLYFVPKDANDYSEGFLEYMLVEDQMELIGDTSADIDLNDVGFAADAEDDEMLVIDTQPVI